MLFSSSQLSFSCSDRLLHFTTVQVVLLSPPSRVDCPDDWKKEGTDVAASSSILVALLICCYARNNSHVDGLYPTSSNSSVHLVSFRTGTVLERFAVIATRSDWSKPHTQCNSGARPWMKDLRDSNTPEKQDSQVRWCFIWTRKWVENQWSPSWGPLSCNCCQLSYQLIQLCKIGSDLILSCSVDQAFSSVGNSCNCHYKWENNRDSLGFK